jgi:hypothetical protein
MNSKYAKTFLLSIPFLALTHSAFAADIDELKANLSHLQIVPVEPTPEPEDIELKIVYPSNGEMKDSLPIRFEARVDGYPTFTASQFERAKELVVDSDGQSVHVIIDDNDYFTAFEPLFDALDDHDLYFDQKIDFSPPFKITPGKHYVRAFPARSYGESLKGPNRFASLVFYYKDKTDKIKMDLSSPYLTYNEPQGTYPESKPILLDFYISNCVMSKDGYKVRLTIDNTVQRTLSTWTPYYIYGLKKGSHKIKLELLDPQNKVVPGNFNTVEKTIKVDKGS